MKAKFVLLAAAAAGGVALTIYTVKLQARPAPSAPPSGEPTRSPFGNRVAGAGLVEPVTEIINMGTPVGGVVQDVLVHGATMCTRARRCSPSTSA
jgi:multidrug efflux pump subunit AcrA (membrane-fusion protein)